MKGASWTPEEDAWLRECDPLHPNAELVGMKPGTPRSKLSIQTRAARLGLAKADGCGGRHTRSLWTDERREWFVVFVPGHTEREISAEHERLFGFPLRESQIGNAKAKFGVKSGTHGGRFEKGNVPATKGRPWSEWMPPESAECARRTQFKPGQLNGISKELDHGRLGERVTKDGYREIRVDPRKQPHTMSRWIPLGALNWMRANGRDWPDDHKALHIDGDPLNDDADNIMPVPIDLWPLVMGAVPGQMPWHDRETLEVAIAYARVTRARVDAERRGRIASGRPRKGDLEAEERRVRKSAPQ